MRGGPGKRKTPGGKGVGKFQEWSLLPLRCTSACRSSGQACLTRNARVLAPLQLPVSSPRLPSAQC